MKSVRVAIFASGTGSNAEALIQTMKTLPQGKVEFVLSDQPEAPVIAKSLREGIATYVVEKTSTRSSHEAEILKIIDRHHIDWIFLAGYMRLLSADFLKAFAARHQQASQVVNIHPSLLPLYPGVNSLERAYADNVAESGVTVHLVDEGMDTGLILNQEKLQLFPKESLMDFKARVHALEHRMYSQLLEQIIQGQRPTKFYKEVSEW